MVVFLRRKNSSSGFTTLSVDKMVKCTFKILQYLLQKILTCVLPFYGDYVFPIVFMALCQFFKLGLTFPCSVSLDKANIFDSKALLDNAMRFLKGFFVTYILRVYAEKFMLLNPFVHSAPFLYPLKTSENIRFSDVFKRQKKDAQETNGLKCFL